MVTKISDNGCISHYNHFNVDFSRKENVMEYSIHHEEDHRLLMVVARGNWVPEADNSMVAEIMQTVDSGIVDKVLLDIRELKFDLPMLQIYERAKTLREQRSAVGRVSSRVALVYSAQNQKLDEDMHFFETASQNRGLPYRVFRDVDEAKEWLNSP